MNFKWSVILCCYNSTLRVGPALQNIFLQDYLMNDPLEVVVVDNNSSDGLEEYISNLTVPASVSIKFVFESEPGLSSARRTGVLASSGDYICWVDDDNDIASDYLTVASQIFDTGEKICFIGGESSWPSSYKEESRPRFVRRFSKAVAVGKQRQFQEGYLQTGDFLWGAGLCMRRSTILGLYLSGFQPILTGRLGKFILSGEDGELTILLQLSGGRGFYSNKLQLQHRVDHSRFILSYFCRLFYGMGLAYTTLHSYRKQTKADLLKKAYVGSEEIFDNTICHDEQRSISIDTRLTWVLFGICFVAGVAKGWMKGFHNRSRANVLMVSNYYQNDQV